MNLNQFLDYLNKDGHFTECIEGIHTVPACEAIFAHTPDRLDPVIHSTLKKYGIQKLYSHQVNAINSALNGNNTLVVTPTASGKSITYMVPIFQKKLENIHSRSLFLFPTKALAQDQLAAIESFNSTANTKYKVFTFDGDTSPDARRKIVEAGDFVLTNPDMLHAGILPHHTIWMKLFENLDFIVIDEVHTYRGVFGSHLANLIRRLLRIAKFYGSSPQFLMASATIGNPGEHARRLIGNPVDVIDKNGAPRGNKHVIFYNPPVVNKSLGIRASAVKEAALLGAHLIKNKISNIIFCRSRLRVELLYTYLQERVPLQKERICSYRGGYLPGQRRKIEKELREGKILSVVSTNALELGIDIGALDVSITLGYPGSISSVWQQFGRAGRRGDDSLSILMATSDGTDQYLTKHPEYFIERNPENAMVNPDNLLIVTDHIKCAAFEIPFEDGEKFGNFQATGDILSYLEDHSIVKRSAGKYHWTDDMYPANSFGLRTGPRENFVIVDITNPGKEEVIGEVDLFAAPTMIHRDAIYIHQGLQYYVEDLIWDDRQARVKRVNVDYFTDAHEKVDISILEDDSKATRNWTEFHSGELMLRIKAVMFKKLKMETHENIGWGDIHTPEIEMHTQGCWILFPEDNPIRKQIPDQSFGAVLAGVANALSIVATVFILSDPRDIRVRSEFRSKSFRQPVIYFYDSFPGGMELSFRMLENISSVAAAASDLIKNCLCENGCPSCTGIPDEEYPVKERSLLVLNLLIDS